MYRFGDVLSERTLATASRLTIKNRIAMMVGLLALVHLTWYLHGFTKSEYHYAD